MKECLLCMVFCSFPLLFVLSLAHASRLLLAVPDDGMTNWALFRLIYRGLFDVGQKRWQNECFFPAYTCGGRPKGIILHPKTRE